MKLLSNTKKTVSIFTRRIFERSMSLSAVFLLIGFALIGLLSFQGQLSLSAMVAIASMVVISCILVLLSVLESKNDCSFDHFERASDDPVFFEYWVK